MHPGSCQLAGNGPGSPRSQGSLSWQEVWDAGIQPSPGENYRIVQLFRLGKTSEIIDSSH